MSKHHGVVWSEGMLLAPQHLQQWERSVHHLVAARFHAAHGFDWGLTQLELDADALRNGRVALLGARGVLPDGTPFAAPDEDALPAPRGIEGNFETRREVLPVHLGLPAAIPGRPLLGDGRAPGKALPRYSAASIELADANTGEDERAVLTARRNLVLLFPGDPLGDYDALPVAEVVRTSDGGYAPREGFVPPCLTIGASDFLVRKLRMLLEALITKSTSMADGRRQRGSIAEFGGADPTGLWMLSAVNAAIPPLSHALAHRTLHPEQVYLSLSALAGALDTISVTRHPKDVPPYRHDALGITFRDLIGGIEELIQWRPDDKAVRIDLERKDGGLYVGRIQDPRLLETSSSIFLGVRAEVEEQHLLSDLPAKMKIASLDRIDHLIAFGLRGVPLQFTRVPPAGLPVNSNFLYFQLDSGSELWEGVKGARNLAIFAPPDYPGMSLELLGLRG